VGTLPANISTDIGKLTEEEMIFLHPWDTSAPLLLALPGEVTRRGTCAGGAVCIRAGKMLGSSEE